MSGFSVIIDRVLDGLKGFRIQFSYYSLLESWKRRINNKCVYLRICYTHAMVTRPRSLKSVIRLACLALERWSLGSWYSSWTHISIGWWISLQNSMEFAVCQSCYDPGESAGYGIYCPIPGHKAPQIGIGYASCGLVILAKGRYSDSEWVN